MCLPSGISFLCVLLLGSVSSDVNNNSSGSGILKTSKAPLEFNFELPENDGSFLSAHDRQKRQLLFPVATLLQVSFCMATPVQLKYYNMFVNQGFQLNFMLPNLRSQLPGTFFGNPPVIDAARSRTKRDQGLLKNIPEEESDVYTSENMYYFMGKAFESYGYNGTACVLHSICKLADIPFHKDEDLLHEIVHFVMTPSEHEVNVGNDENETAETFKNSKPHIHKLLDSVTPFNEYLKAELAGKAGKNCDDLYKFCPRSPLAQISEILYEDDDGEND